MISVLTEFCMSVLMTVYKDNNPIFDEVYNKLCNTLCVVAPLSLRDQPNAVQSAYTEIQNLLSNLISDPS